MKISTEELNELLQKEFERGRQSAIDALKQGEPKQPIRDIYTPYNAEDLLPEACKNCPKHPINGGDGICHCILGLTPITYSTTTIFK